jgi:hypothetical protein
MKHERWGHIYDGGTGMDSPAGTQHLDGEIRADLGTSDALPQEDFFWDSPRGSEVVGGYSARYTYNHMGIEIPIILAID